jgi:hypothetical protein
MSFFRSENLSFGEQARVDEWVRSEPELGEAYRLPGQRGFDCHMEDCPE